MAKSHRLKSIQRLIDKNKAKKKTEVPDLLARFDDLLLRYNEDYKTDAQSDELKKEAPEAVNPQHLGTGHQGYHDVSGRQGGHFVILTSPVHH